MSDLVFTLISLPILTTGRRLFALKQCLEAARALTEAQLIDLIEAAIAHDTATLTMEQAWVRSRGSSEARGEAASIDNRIDALLGALYTALKDNTVVFGSETPAFISSDRILNQLFSEGVRPIITLPFEEQLAVNATIAGRLTGDLQQDAAAAGVERFVSTLTSLNEAFGVELEKSTRREVDFSALDAARDKGNLFVRQIVAVVLGAYYQDDDAAAVRRRALLGPILKQRDLVRQARKGHRKAQDVDPNTGEDLADATEAA